MIPEHPTHKIHDSTKLIAYLKCPRSYFYEYVLGWRSDIPEVHKHFGTCWHLAQKYLLLNKLDTKSYEKAVELLTDKYREKFTEMTDGDRAPKTPGHARLALAMYCKEFKAKDNFEVLYTEIAGTVPIAVDRIMHFKMDSILRDLNNNNLIMSLEHKTGSQNSQQWRDSWKLSIQTGTYNHVLFCAFPEEEVWGVMINGAIFTKGKIAEFPRIPVRRTPRMMDAWLYAVNNAINHIELDFARLDGAKEGDDVLMAFTPTFTSCSSYSGCSYFDFCTSWANPLQHLGETPIGFKLEYWNPAKIEDVTEVTIEGMKGGNADVT